MAEIENLKTTLEADVSVMNETLQHTIKAFIRKGEKYYIGKKCS